MTDVMPRNAPVPVVGPVHIPAVSWFEFVLDENLLAKHLAESSPDPPAGQLICDFLLQANRQVTQLHFTQPTDDLSENDDILPTKTNIKIQTLKHLSLKVAAFLKWDLSTIEKCVPNGIVQALLGEFLHTTGVDKSQLKTLPDNITDMRDEAVFSLQLYHRWCLRTIVRNSFPTKPNVKTGFICAPDFGSNRMYGDNLKPVQYAEMKDNEDTSVAFLERCIQCGRDLRVPSMRTIGVATESREDIKHRWEDGHLVSQDQLRYLISFDLGSFYFYKENYTKALEMFSVVKAHHDSVSTDLIHRVDISRLAGYYTACTNLLSIQTEPTCLTIREKLDKSRRENYKDVWQVLLEDNVSQELTLEHRDDIEQDIIAKLPNDKDLLFRVRVCTLVWKVSEADVITRIPPFYSDKDMLFRVYECVHWYGSDKDLLFRVRVCTLVRKVREGKAVLTDLSDDLQASTQNSDFLIGVLRQSMSTAAYGQRSNVKCFIWHTVQTLPRESYFTESLLKNGFQSYFDDDDYSELSTWDEESTFVSSFVSCTAEKKLSAASKNKDKLMGVGEVERQLLSAYDPDLIKSLIYELCDKWGRKPQQIMALNDKWKLVRELRHGVEQLHTSPLQAYVFVLIAKARHCMDMRIFERSRQLLQVADTAIKDMSYILRKRIRWQMTLADMKQAFINDTGVNSAMRELAKKAKTCLTALRLNQDVQPSSEVVEQCTAFLINVRDWEYMCSLDNTRNTYIELARQMAAVCKDLPQVKVARKAARELWDTVLGIFCDGPSQHPQHKRGASARAGPRDSPQPPLFSQSAFVTFITKIREPVALTMLISCMTKFYNLLRDDITVEIFSDYITLWPSNLNVSKSANTAAVGDALGVLMQHAIQTHPTQPSWLHTQADIFFAHERHAPAMKFYLESGVVATDFFCEPITRAVYDDQVHRRMIKCCSYLKCHTQVAVLCQYLEEVDYLTCFKALQERNTYDAMDTYYAYIWDVSILEFLVHLHTKRGELEKKQAATRALSQLDLNSNNPDDVLIQAINSRKRKFLQSLAKQYL